MAFVKLDKSSRTVNGIQNATVAMGAYLADGKAHKSKSVSFRLSYAMIKQLGWGTPDGRVSIAILEGTDEDRGFLQLVEDPDGYRGATNSSDGRTQGTSITVRVERFRHYVLNECPVTSAYVTHVVDGNVLIIECPDWLRFNPLSVPQIAPEPEPVYASPDDVVKVTKDLGHMMELEVPMQRGKISRKSRRVIGNQIAKALR